jgi:predicted PP-loop superfamily ATPase
MNSFHLPSVLCSKINDEELAISQLAKLFLAFKCRHFYGCPFYSITVKKGHKVIASSTQYAPRLSIFSVHPKQVN